MGIGEMGVVVGMGMAVVVMVAVMMMWIGEERGRVLMVDLLRR